MKQVVKKCNFFFPLVIQPCRAFSSSTQFHSRQGWKIGFGAQIETINRMKLTFDSNSNLKWIILEKRMGAAHSLLNAKISSLVPVGQELKYVRWRSYEWFFSFFLF